MCDLRLQNTVSNQAVICRVLEWALVTQAFHTSNVRKRAKFDLVDAKWLPLTFFLGVRAAAVPPIAEVPHRIARFSPHRDGAGLLVRLSFVYVIDFDAAVAQVRHNRAVFFALEHAKPFLEICWDSVVDTLCFSGLNF